MPQEALGRCCAVGAVDESYCVQACTVHCVRAIRSTGIQDTRSIFDVDERLSVYNFVYVHLSFVKPCLMDILEPSVG